MRRADRSANPRLRNETPQKFCVQPVPRLMHGHRPEEEAIEQKDVAKEIEQLMPHKLIVATQSTLIHHAGIGDDNGILQ